MRFRVGLAVAVVMLCSFYLWLNQKIILPNQRERRMLHPPLAR
jgi:hypothetical protein